MSIPSSLDDAYANAPYIPDGMLYPGRWAEAARQFRSTARAAIGMRYGDREREQFDLFWPSGPTKGLVVFVHGGFWRAFGKDDWSHLAAGSVAAGWAVAVVGYDLCPEVRIGTITKQIACAIDMAADRVPGPIRLVGHSAGGHLVARMGCTDVPLRSRARIDLIMPISPLADLAPLMLTSMNKDFRLDDAEAQSESPVNYPRPDSELTIWVGGAERPAFLHQAQLLGDAWGIPVIEDAGRHHFDVIEGLEREDSMMMRALLAEF